MVSTITVIGLGYVGLPTALVFAECGYFVSGYDTDTDLISDLNQSIYRGEEPKIGELLSKEVSTGKFSASHKLLESDAYIICVPTPIDEKTKRPMMDDVNDVVLQISSMVKDGNLVVLCSTSPIGTTDKIFQLLNLNSDKNVNSKNGHVMVAYCPERIMPGNTYFELTNLDRVVGGCTDYSTEIAQKVFSRITKGKCVATDARTAELVKLSENSFRDVNISFANELNNLCERFSIDFGEVRQIANLHPRVDILESGIGVGGHCIPVDPWLLVESYSEVDRQNSVIVMARNVNDCQTELATKKIQKLIGADKVSMVVLLGMTYKKNSADYRNSPAIKIYKSLRNLFPSRIEFCEPLLSDNFVIEGKAGIKLDEVVANDDINFFIKLVDHDVFGLLVDPLREKGKHIKSIG